MVTKSKFKFVGGTLCLDFVNTVGGRDASNFVLRDKFVDCKDLIRWVEFAGLLNHTEARAASRQANADKRSAQAVFDRAIVLREALYRICLLPAAGDLAALNRELAGAFKHERLSYARSQFRWTWDQPACLDRILWNISRSAAMFLVSPEFGSVRQCPGSECGWMFLDTSRNHSRQWCEMRICGNRAKARRFRERVHTAPGRA